MAKLTQPWFTTSSSTSNPRGLDKFLFSTIAHAGKRRIGGAYCSSSGIPPGFHGLSSAVFPLNLPLLLFRLAADNYLLYPQRNTKLCPHGRPITPELCTRSAFRAAAMLGWYRP